MARFTQEVIDLLRVLFDTGFVEVVDDRGLAAQVYRAARDGSAGWAIGGGVCFDEVDGTAIYSITADPPLCDGGCGDRTASPTGMCYQCGCEAHAEGWFNMDTGRVRMETDAEAHRRLDYEAALDAKGGF